MDFFIVFFVFWVGLILFLQGRLKSKGKANNYKFNSRSNLINIHDDWHDTRRTSSAYSHLPYNVNHISRD